MALKDFLKNASEKVRTTTSDLTGKFVDSEFGQKINAAELIVKTKNTATKTVAKVKKVTGTAKRYAYTGAGKFEEQYNQKQSIGGGVRKAISRGRLLCKGLKFASKPLGSEKVTDKTKGYYRKLHDYNQSFIKTFTTKGQYDPKKLSDALKHKTAIAEIWGAKAVSKLGELAQKAGSAVHEDYRGWIPTLEELTDKYAGIGVKCKGLMLKPDLEACLSFYTGVFKNEKLPRDDLALSIMQDIKANVITSKDELLKFYMIEGNAKENQNKARVVINYL